MNVKKELLAHLDSLHTTALGYRRIQKHLSLHPEEDVVKWCRRKICLEAAVVYRKGKNYYVDVEGSILTIHAHSYTIITAHQKANRHAGKAEKS